MSNFNDMPEVNICLLLFSALIVFFLMIGAMADQIRNHSFMKKFICLLLADIFMQLGEAGIWVFQGSPENIPFLKLCCVLSFGLGFVVIALFTSCLMEYFRGRGDVSRIPDRIMAVFCGGMILLVVVSAFNGMFFSFDGQGKMVDGPFWYIICIFDIVAIFAMIVLILWCRKFLTLREIIFFLSFCILPLASALMVGVWYSTPEYLAVTLALIVVYMLFYREISRQLEDKKKELVESRIAIMVSQIQPHFLYNSLNTIYHLCSKDVKTAQRAISDFSEYLHGSLSSLTRNDTVPFEEELKHVQTYLELEKLRFGENLNVVYKIESTSFFLPALSVQPLIENAVKHGICAKEGGGTIILAAKEYSDYFEVTVSDDGVGYSVGKIPRDGKLHVGIENVRKRLSAMSHASLMIESEPGNGTTVTIHIPKEDGNEDNSTG